jgi:hypothetical protein
MKKEFNIDDYSPEEIERTKKAVIAASDFVNNYGHSPELFTRLMANEHRTLQQSFTKLILSWLEYIASDEYRTDGRNEASKQTAEKLAAGWKLLGKQDEKLTYGMPPSSWLPLI